MFWRSKEENVEWREPQRSEFQKREEEPLSKPTRSSFVESEELLPLASQLSFGSAAGYASGYALRAAGRLAAIAVGTGFIFVQGLAYSGYIKVDWTKVQSDYTKLLDVDQDGAITSQDAAIIWRRMSDVLQHNLPTGLGFSGGMLYGMGTKASTAGKAALLFGAGSRIILPRAAVAGAAGLGTAGIPAFLEGVRERLGRDTVSEDEAFNNLLLAGDPRQLKSLYDKLRNQHQADTSRGEPSTPESGSRLHRITDRLIEMKLLDPDLGEQEVKKEKWSWPWPVK